MQAMGDSPRVERRLRITTECDTDEIRVWVEDRGPGIQVDRIRRVFEPLATWKPGGTGMGLAISNTIIRSHGGRMSAENRHDGGARVGFALPVQTEGQGDE
jgi:signal transduction histidine kinase